MAFPDTLQSQFKKLSPDSQSSLEKTYESRRKHLSVAYTCWLLFGFQYLYMGQIGKQFLYWFTLGGFGIWAICDLFQLPKRLNGVNEDIARKLLMEFKSLE
jgi:TM2 domain-containing membrane protein YozV